MLDNLGDLRRTHSCGQLRAEHVGRTVTLMGWVARRRDFGPLTFFDLRDRDGITQVVFDAEDAPAAHAKGKEVRGEYVIAVTGEVVAREEGERHPTLATGEVEVQARELLLLNTARTLPFQLEVTSSDAMASEDVRLKYRYLDLRRPALQANLRLRAKVVAAERRYLDEQAFTEIETPILIKSTPEGARDYVVPSRLYPGRFYALPQSPQIFKQICMIAGLDKYYQIARCFRDEDLRADRQPEFTQLDIEFSFATREQVYRLIEGLYVRVFRLVGAELPRPFPRLSYAEATRRYGVDKPDLRFGMELQDLRAAVEGTTFAPFASALEKLGDELSSSLLKALGEEAVTRLAAQAGAEKGDAVLVVAGKASVVAASLGALRNEVARREKLIKPNTFAPLWVTEFPMFEYHEEDGRYYAMHHPFTSPVDEDLDKF